MKIKFQDGEAHLIVNVSGQLEGGMQDWPPRIQDEIYLALERLALRTRKPYEIKMSKCDYDVDSGWFVHVVATSQREISLQ